MPRKSKKKLDNQLALCYTYNSNKLPVGKGESMKTETDETMYPKVLYVRIGQAMWAALRDSAAKTEDTTSNLTRRVLREWLSTHELPPNVLAAKPNTSRFTSGGKHGKK
jgi:hypothetical protein